MTEQTFVDGYKKCLDDIDSILNEAREAQLEKVRDCTKGIKEDPMDLREQLEDIQKGQIIVTALTRVRYALDNKLSRYQEVLDD